MMDDFGDEIAGMDPQGRCIREPGYGTEFARQMLDDASGPGGIVLVAEDNGRIVGFASGRVETRAERERLAVIDFRNGIVPELYVSPDWRRRGVGRALLARLDQHFRGQRCQASVIEVFAPERRGTDLLREPRLRRARHLVLRGAVAVSSDVGPRRK